MCRRPAPLLGRAPHWLSTPPTHLHLLSTPPPLTGAHQAHGCAPAPRGALPAHAGGAAQGGRGGAGEGGSVNDVGCWARVLGPLAGPRPCPHLTLSCCSTCCTPTAATGILSIGAVSAPRASRQHGRRRRRRRPAARPKLCQALALTPGAQQGACGWACGWLGDGRLLTCLRGPSPALLPSSTTRPGTPHPALPPSSPLHHTPLIRAWG